MIVAADLGVLGTCVDSTPAPWIHESGDELWREEFDALINGEPILNRPIGPDFLRLAFGPT